MKDHSLASEGNSSVKGTQMAQKKRKRAADLIVGDPMSHWSG